MSEKLTPSFIDVSQWTRQDYVATGGTRSKNIVVDDDNQEWFIKGSKVLEDGTIRYPLEFWSEIVASKLGQYFGFNVLDYNIAYDANNESQPVQCISKSMIRSGHSTLSEGIQYLMGHLPNFDLSSDEDQYSVDFIEGALKTFGLEEQFPKFIETLIFDALIGNSDRHSENWGFISDFEAAINEINRELSQSKSQLKKFVFRIAKYSIGLLPQNQEQLLKSKYSSRKRILRNHSMIAAPAYSPIYDSGCCLGRELLDEKIQKLLKNEQMLTAHVKRGRSTVRWRNGKAPRHFDLLDKIVETYKEDSHNILGILRKKNDPLVIREIISEIDSKLPFDLRNFGLPESRKELMISLINKRLEILESYL
ncbi:MAG: hypothetical protein ACI83B_001155 [Sediminicola sp.]|jgi:hypothetical protein